ncbi:MAG: hypothetical protein AAGE89_14460 [Pseudomonadota bacterium]
MGQLLMRAANQEGLSGQFDPIVDRQSQLAGTGTARSRLMPLSGTDASGRSRQAFFYPHCGHSTN